MFKKPAYEVALDKAINEALAELSTHTADSKEYAQTADQVVKLYQLKKKSRISPDVLVTASANILGILVIVGHERAHVVTSKALAFVAKLR